MNATSDVTAWFRFIQDVQDDARVARQLLDELEGYKHSLPHNDMKKNDTANLLALITAIRLDQMTKENS